MNWFYFIFLSLLLSSCNARFSGFFGAQPLPLPTVGSLRFTAVGPVTSYTCVPVTLSAFSLSGAAWIASANTSVTLSGLGQGNAYSTLANCRAGSSTSTVFINAGSSTVQFYYRTNAAESLTFSASASQLDVATTPVTTYLFQVLGQSSGTGSYQYHNGLNSPWITKGDGTHLVVVDSQNNRVLIWNSIPTTHLQSPDLVLGQPNLTSVDSNNGGLSASSLSNPRGVAIFGNKLFVADLGNNRVLVWNTLPTTNGQAADLVLGQPDFISDTPNNGGTLATTMNTPSCVFFDGTHVLVTDSTNHRILIWQTFPTSNGQAADNVLGQPDMNGSAPNNGGLSGSTLWAPLGIYSDGIKVYVADGKNSRILVWNTFPNSDGLSADFALGQSDLVTNNGAGPAADSLSFPMDVWIDGGKLYVVDGNNNRVLVWNTLPTTFQVPANFALGQPDLVTGSVNTGGISGATLSAPNGVYALGSKLFVGDTSNNRILIWNSLSGTTGQAASFTLGQYDLTSTTMNNGGALNATLYNPRSVSSDGTHLIVADTANNRVLIWNTIPTTDGQSPDLVLGQPDLNSNASNNGGLTGSALNNPHCAYSNGTKLFVCDHGNNRVLVWNTFPTTNGQAASFALGQPNLTSNAFNNGGISGSSLYHPYAVHSDGTRLFVMDTDNNRVLIWNAMPTSNGQAASVVLGQATFATNTATFGGLSNSSLTYSTGVFTVGTKLLVNDYLGQRVLIWNTIPTVNNQGADLVLGQPNFTSWTSNNGGLSASSLYYPFSSWSDGVRLFVSDLQNNRIQIWNSFPTVNNQPADSVVGQPNFTTNTENTGGLTASRLYQPMGIYSDGIRIFIADIFNNRILIAPIPGI